MVDGKSIRVVTRTCWQPDDDARVRNARVIGRGCVELEGGTVVEALILASTDERTLGQRFAQIFEPWSSRIVLVEIA